MPLINLIGTKIDIVRTIDLLILYTSLFQTKELCQYEVNKIVFSVKPRQLKDDFTCFHFAAKKGQVEVVKAMLNK